MAIILGHDFSKLTQEEKDAIMAEWRSRRNGNGRKGYKMPDRQLIDTNNFEDPNKTWKPGKLKRSYNEHIKCIFICSRELYAKAYGKSKIYYIGFLSDSNKVSFEEFRDAPSRKVIDKANLLNRRLDKYLKLFGKKNIDSNTDVVLCKNDIDEANDFMPIILNFMKVFTGFHLSRISYGNIIQKFISEYGIFGKEANTIFKNCKRYPKRSFSMYFHAIYCYMVENAVCPWITKDSYELISSFTAIKRRSWMLVELGTLYALIVKFAKLQRQNEKST